jgi:Zn-dependent peptidase ImmA (M78 family)
MTAHLSTQAKAERAALDLLARHGVSEPPIDPIALAKAEGIRTIVEHLPNDTSSVLFREPSGRRTIAVNRYHSETRRRFSVAHEIGHALLHLTGYAPSTSEAAVSRPLEVLFRDGLAGEGTDRKEIEANTFAANLLMPAQQVTEAFRNRLKESPKTKTDNLIKELASYFGVSVQAMRYRLVNLGVVDPA